MPKVSVLVAVYNAEPFLQKCLDSLVTQTLDDIQVICIDDASTDGSPAILEHYVAQDSRFEVIGLAENQGQAHARNAGLRRAKGDYICMLDADDWLAPDALEQALGAFDDVTDCVLFEVMMNHDDGREEPYPMKPFDTITGEEAFRRSLSWAIHGLYMVRAKIHQCHPYDETCRLYSDDNTTRIHYVSSRQVRCCRGRYYYRQHAASATHCSSVRRFDYLKANESMRRQMEELGVSAEVMAGYENYRWLNLIDVCMFYHVHGCELTAEARRFGLGEIRRVWASIDREALNKETTAKFGYRPCMSWFGFRAQEWLYFTLRGFLGRNR